MSTENEVVAPWAPTALDRSAEALIKEMETEFDAKAVDDQLAAVESAPDPVVEAADTPDGQPAPQTPAPVAPADVKLDPSTPGFSEAVARELALSRREEAVKAQEARYAQLEEEVKGYKTRMLPENVIQGLRTQATSTLEALGIDPDQVVRMVLAERLGDKAPDELRKEIAESQKDHKYDARMRALETELADTKRANAARAYYEGIQAGARQYIKEAGINEHAPVVARVAKTAPDRVFQEIMEVISQDAQIKAIRDPSAPLLTYEQAAKHVEARWADLNRYLVPENAQNVTPEAPKTPAPKTPPITGSIKPPDRPLAPWLTRSNELEEAGLKAALAEYKRLQTPGSPQ